MSGGVPVGGSELFGMSSAEMQTALLMKALIKRKREIVRLEKIVAGLREKQQRGVRLVRDQVEASNAGSELRAGYVLYVQALMEIGHE